MSIARHLLPVGLLLLASARAESPVPRHAVFRSTDRGRTWTPADAGLAGTPRINALARTPHTFVAGTDVGPFVSRDLGVSWTAGIAPSNAPVCVLALVTYRSRLYAGTWNQGLLVSSDGGTRWDPVPGFPPVTVRSLAVSSEGLAVGTDAQGVFVSADPGQGWERRDAGLPKDHPGVSFVVTDDLILAGITGNEASGHR